MNYLNEAEHNKQLYFLLKKIRKENDLTQVTLAKRLDVPQSFVSKYESGDRRLDVLELKKICQAIGISIFNFLHRLEEILDETK